MQKLNGKWVVMPLPEPILRAMKITTILLTVFCMHATAGSIAQVTLSGKVPVEEVFDAIRKQTDYHVLYGLSDLKGTKSVTIDVKNASVLSVLQTVLKDQPLEFSIEGKNIFIKRKFPINGIEINKAHSSNYNKISPSHPPKEISAIVTDSLGNPLKGAIVSIKNKNKAAVTDENGYFRLQGVEDGDYLEISFVGYLTLIISERNVAAMNTLRLTINPSALAEVVVQGNNGYSAINRQHPGSFSITNRELLNRRISSDVISRIENIVPGVSFGNFPSDQDNPYGLMVRGRNSINSSVAPLIILDNFPYDGNINSINPNDIESVTVLRDAAAAALWGARAGNGVIILSSKRGKTQRPTLEFVNNITFQSKPNLNKIPTISSTEAIEVEKWLFEKGFYDEDINNTYLNPPLSFVQETLLKLREGQITKSEAETILEPLKKINVYDDLEKYFYRSQLNHQHALNVSGSTPNINYYMSVGWDEGFSNQIGQKDSRWSLRNQTSFRITRWFEIDAGIYYVQRDAKGNGNIGVNTNHGSGKNLAPYTDLVDNNGNGLKIIKNNRLGYLESLGAPLDWSYNPYEDMNNISNRLRGRDVMLTTALRVTLLPGLKAEFKYQYQNGLTKSETNNSVESFQTRDMINSFYQPAAADNYPVPIGDIVSQNNNELNSHQGRLQLVYDKVINRLHKLSFMGGLEMKDLNIKENSFMMFGYNRDGSVTKSNLDFATYYPQFNFGQFAEFTTAQIPRTERIGESNDRFVSYFSNVLYSYNNKYTLSLSARQDAANLFGVKTNQQSVPLWSVGGGWEISNEKYYYSKMFPYLKLRASYGYNGNFSRQVSAITTIAYRDNLSNFGANQAYIVNPPNESLKWEQVRIINVGLDFSLKNNRVSGTLEWWKKDIKDLMAEGPLDPTSGLTPTNGGLSFYYGNIASMRGSGYDFQINTININGKFKWQSNIFVSYALNKVRDYYLPAPTTATGYVGYEQSISPLVGKPIYVLYSYAWGGLESQTGDPMGYLGKSKSKDYQKILNNTKIDSLIYHGPAQPPYFGAFRNTFSWGGLSLSANISYKFGYSFRRNHLSYNSLYTTWTGHSDYSKRWQKSGDENFTQIPSQVYTDYPQFYQRENFYHYSEINVLKGDHVRLEDVVLIYNLQNKATKLPFKQISLNLNISNLNILLWKANDEGIDPYFPQGNITKPRIAFGMVASF